MFVKFPVAYLTLILSGVPQKSEIFFQFRLAVRFALDHHSNMHPYCAPILIYLIFHCVQLIYKYAY